MVMLHQRRWCPSRRVRAAGPGVRPDPRLLLTVAGLDWIYASRAQLIEPGERAGVFRIGGDELLTDADGSSRITIPDYAAGIVDQLENPTAHRKQITFAY
jgi:putative NADH-flavin reductase